MKSTSAQEMAVSNSDQDTKVAKAPVNNVVQIRKIEERDLNPLLESIGLGKDWEPYLRWLMKFRSEEQLFLVAILREQVIGYYANLATPLKVGDRTVTAYRGGIRVSPEHRKKKYNVFNLLVRKAHEEVKNKEAVIWGFPIPELVRYYTHRVGFHFLGMMPKYVRALNIPAFLKEEVKEKRIVQALRFLLRFLIQPRFSKARRRSCEIEEIRFFDERFDELWKNASKEYQIACVRDREFLNWMYVERPNQEYMTFAGERNRKILGYIILESAKEDQNTGVIVDLFGIRDQAVIESLLLKAVEYFRTKKVNRVQFYLSDENFETILKSLGFFKQAGQECGSHLIVKSYSSVLDPDYFGNRQNWFITAAEKFFA